MGTLEQTGNGKVRVGGKAPEFSLQSHDGKTISLSDYRGKKSLVVYFYPKDETPGCTVESCTFRDFYEEFTEAGAEVIGISSDSVESHVNFAEHHDLPFVLLTDEDQSVRSAYGATGLFLPGRITYVIDKEGVVRYIFSSQAQVKRHVREALEIIKGLPA